MAKKRGPDGIPVDVPSHKPPNRDSGSAGAPAGGDQPTDLDRGPPRGAGKDKGGGSLFPEEPPTAPMGKSVDDQPGPAADSPRDEADDAKTVIHGGRRPARGTAGDEAPAAGADTGEALLDPVAGWLVIVEGPGVGQVLTVGHGQNSIGRSPEERISIDFGDGEISRSSHAAITYDPRGRRFFCQQGSGSNLIYLNDEPVLSPTPLENHAEILIGQTRLRFVAFCGPDFSWQDR